MRPLGENHAWLLGRWWNLKRGEQETLRNFVGSWFAWSGLNKEKKPDPQDKHDLTNDPHPFWLEDNKWIRWGHPWWQPEVGPKQNHEPLNLSLNWKSVRIVLTLTNMVGNHHYLAPIKVLISGFPGTKQLMFSSASFITRLDTVFLMVSNVSIIRKNVGR